MLLFVLLTKIASRNIYKRDDPMFADAVAQAKKDGVKLEGDSKIIRDGNKVRVYRLISCINLVNNGINIFTIILSNCLFNIPFTRLTIKKQRCICITTVIK
jgi:hypothetical protein